jgi:heme/copper-type cytochrome/quinol oxidase subunit 1
VLVNYIRQYQIDSGVPKAQAYNTTMYIMAGLLVIGFICNFMIKAVSARYHMKENDPRAHDATAAAPQPQPSAVRA